SYLFPRIVESEQDAGYVNAPFAAEIAEVQTANHLVGDEQRVGIDQNANGFIQSECQILELVFDLLILFRHEIPPPQPNDFRKMVSQENRQVSLHCGAGGDYRLAKQIAQGAALDRCRRDFGPLTNQT